MSTTSLHDGIWRSVIARLSAVADLEATARSFKAFERRGKVADAASLLRLILMYSVGHLSLRATAAAACGTIATLSDKAVEGRLRKSGDWLEHLLQALLCTRAGAAGPACGLALVDGSVIKPPGAGGQWRVHARYDPARGGFADLQLTPAGTAEAATLTRLDAGQTVITDRGYARVRNIEAVLEAGSHVLTRIGWRSLKLLDTSGRPFDLFACLPRGAAAGGAAPAAGEGGACQEARPAQVRAQRQHSRLAHRAGGGLSDAAHVAVGRRGPAGSGGRDVSRPLAGRTELQATENLGWNRPPAQR